MRQKRIEGQAWSWSSETGGAMMAGSKVGMDESSNRNTPGTSSGLDVGGRSRKPGGLVFLCASGGAGLTTLVAMVSKMLTRRSHVCVLADMDLAGGGMDVLLGIEGAPGLRLGQIRAPLGRMDSQALQEELPVWDGIPVLSNDPWNGRPPGWWDMDAALRAMSCFADLILIDAGRGTDLENLRSLAGLPRVLLVDMTVLGLARARSLLVGPESFQGAGVNGGGVSSVTYGDPSARVPRQEGVARGGLKPGSDRANLAGPDPLAVIGILPRAGRSSSVVDQEEAADFLGFPPLCVLKPSASLAGSILSGLGLEKIPRSYLKALDSLIGVIEDSLLTGPGEVEY
ncbi:hypothetical protein [Bifidobacterium indicum]|uniref:hypothetical protein n=2 Tax=Bifidobacterium indicum TaxID=1691 RepID=UPI0030D809B5